MNVSNKTSISIAIVVVLICAAISFGQMYQKVETVSQDVKDLKVQVADIQNSLMRTLAMK